MSVPAWKQAILDRKKKAEEEQRKKEEEEAAYIASLPPWKRAIVKKQREQTSPASTLDRKEAKAKSAAMPASDDPSSKWMAAIQMSKEKSSPVPTRASWAKPASTPTTPNKPNKEPAPVKSDVATAQKSHSFSGALANFSRASTTPKASHSFNTPKPTSSFSSVKTSSSFSSAKTTTPSESVPRMGRRESITVLPTVEDNVVTPSPVISGGVSLRSKENEPKVVVSDKRRSFEGEDDEDAKLAAMPAWKKALILRRRAAQKGSDPKPPGPLYEPKPPAKTKENTPSFAKQQPKPVQKVAAPEPVIESPVPERKMVERKQVSKPPVEDEDETDSPYTTPQPKNAYSSRTAPKPNQSKSKSNAPKPSQKIARPADQNTTPKQDKKPKTIPASKSPSAKPLLTKKDPPQKKPAKPKPEVVNRVKNDSNAPAKKVEQEGSVHRPPVYKVVDEWANVPEDDPAFKKLPLWKQALIKRRRSDYAKRSNPVVVETAPPKKANTAQQVAWNSEQATTANKNVKNLSTDIRPARSAPEPPKKQPMFSFSFSKNKVDAGSDSEVSDSDLEDVTVTNIDEISDEDSGIGKDSGVIITSYKVTNTEFATAPADEKKPKTSKVSSAPIPKTDSKSILVTPDKSRRHMRRVSWSDSNLTEEHFYPKYSYDDYDEINNDNQNEESSDNELSQPIHPSMRSTNETDSDLYRYSPGRASSLGSYTPSIMSSYSSNMASHLSGFSPRSNTTAKPPPSPVKEEPVYSNNDAGNDFYSHLTTDTAALLW